MTMNMPSAHLLLVLLAVSPFWAVEGLLSGRVRAVVASIGKSHPYADLLTRQRGRLYAATEASPVSGKGMDPVLCGAGTGYLLKGGRVEYVP